MEEIKVGEYVRTKDGLVLRYDEKNDKIFIDNFKNDRLDILKHSPNIIDLIEVGDYVNGVLVIEKYKFMGKQRLCMLSTMEYGYDNEMLEEHIKTILPKEQYQANCYEVK